MRPSIDYLFLALAALCVALVLLASLMSMNNIIGFVFGFLAFNGCCVLTIYNAGKYFSQNEEERTLPF